MMDTTSTVLHSFNSTTEKAIRVRLDYVAALRAICVILVMVGHAAGMLINSSFSNLSHWGRDVLNFFYQVRAAINTVIVNSGSCLMLPVARNGSRVAARPVIIEPEFQIV